MRIALFLLLINLVLGGAIHVVGEERISQVLLSGSVLQPFVAALLGFIPNCASSVILTELYLAGSLSFGAAVAGLCTGAGVGLAVLFKYNRHWKENLLLAAILYVSAVATGLVCGAVVYEGHYWASLPVGNALPPRSALNGAHRAPAPPGEGPPPKNVPPGHF